MIISASFADPYVLVLLDNGSVIVYKCDKQTLELEAIPVLEHIKVRGMESATRYGCLPEL